MSDVMVRPQAATFLDLLNSKKGQIERVLPKHLKAEWMLQIAVNVWSRTPGGDTGMWAHDTPEAWKKTAIRRLRKQLPFSIGLSKADEIDAQAEAGEAQVFVIPEVPRIEQRDDLDDEEIPR